MNEELEQTTGNGRSEGTGTSPLRRLVERFKQKVTGMAAWFGFGSPGRLTMKRLNKSNLHLQHFALRKFSDQKTKIYGSIYNQQKCPVLRAWPFPRRSGLLVGR